MKNATQNFGKKEYNQSTKWYYVGQIRFKAHLLANPNLDRSGDPALYASIKYVIGKPINEYAGGVPDQWVTQIEEAIKWHNDNENSFTPKYKHKNIYKKLISEYEKSIRRIKNNKALIEKKRSDNGLSNS